MQPSFIPVCVSALAEMSAGPLLCISDVIIFLFYAKFAQTTMEKRMNFMVRTLRRMVPALPQESADIPGNRYRASQKSRKAGAVSVLPAFFAV